MSRTITTNGTIGVYLSDPLDNPVMVAASGTIITANDYAILGSAAVAWTLTNFGRLSGGQYGMHFAGSATIANKGTMAATGTKSTGVLLEGGGNIVNGAAGFLGARISGSYLGVQIAGGEGTVVNLGTITSSDMPGSGAVALMQGGTVTNGSTAVTSAAISGGGAAGVYIIGGTSALVINQGTIIGQGGGAAAVALWSGGTVVNGAPGNSAATITAPNAGVYVTGGTGTVVNDGVIAGGAGASWGVYMRAGGIVTNGVAGSRINGAYRTVDIRGNAGTVVNSGTIAGLPGSSFGVYLGAGGTISNVTTASVITAAYNAIVVRGAPGSVVNHGNIVGSTSMLYNGSGVLLQAGGNVTNGGSGNTDATIEAALNAVKISGGSGTVVNDGTMAGEFGVYLYNGGTATNGLAASVIKTSYFGIRVGGSTGTVLNFGTITSTGTNNYGVMLRFGGEVTNAASGLITGGARGIDLAVSSTGTVSNSGMVSSVLGVTMPTTSGVITNAGTIIGTGGTAVLGGNGDDRVILRPGAAFQGKVLGVTGNNVLELAAGSTAGSIGGIGSDFIDFGTIAFDAGGQWSISGDTTGLAGTISGFAPGDTIEVTDITVTGYDYAAGVLTLNEASGSVELNLPGAFTTSDFVVTNVAEGVDVSLTAPCFVTGTRIRTERGPVAVEALQIGDRVPVALGGKAETITWLGHRHVDCRRHPRPEDVWPVCISAGAFGPARPFRDLWLSPDHALFIGGALVPVRYLLNGRTIFQQRRDKVTYWHVELAEHNVLYAEGVPSESYLDTGNRSAFDNGGCSIDLHPDFARQVWDTHGCAPLALNGLHLTAAKHWFLTRAHILGHRTTNDGRLNVQSDGSVLNTRKFGQTWHVQLPRASNNVRLVSRTWIPAHMRPDSDDLRSLGVAISRVRLDGHEVALDSSVFSSGWHTRESEWRWTDGDALLATAGACELTFQVKLTGTYWHQEKRKMGLPRLAGPVAATSDSW